MNKLKIQYYAPVQDPTGLGLASREIERVLRGTRHNVYRQNMEIHPGGGGRKLCKKFANYDIDLSGADQAKDPDVTIIFAPPNQLAAKAKILWDKKSLLLGYTMWETDKLNENTANDIKNLYDGILVPTWENLNMFDCIKDNWARRISLPMKYDPSLAPRREINPSEPVRFCSCFEWSDRKGGEDLLTAFILAFDKKDASLTIKTRGLTENKLKELIADIRRKTKTKNNPLIKIINMELCPVGMNDFYKNHDCFAILTRGEGWCYPVADAYARGLGVVMTEDCGVSEFMNAWENFFTIQAFCEPVIGMEHFAEMDATHYWHKPSIGNAIDCLRDMARYTRNFTLPDHSYIEKNIKGKYCLDACITQAEVAIDNIISIAKITEEAVQS